MSNCIIGAGFSGLAAGYKTGWPIYEAAKEPGGICKTYIKDGFTFQSGGPHWLFGENETIEWIKGLVDLKSYDRFAGVYYNHIFPYPIQTYTQRPIEARTGHFKHWLASKFSLAECNMFFDPFNKKYTADLYDEIVQFDSYKTPPAGAPGHVVKFHDPVGGLNTLVDKFVQDNSIHYSKRAVKIDVINKYVTFNDHTSVKFDKLISTMPLSQTLSMCGQNNYDLPYSSVFVINIGANPGVNLPKQHWLYIPFCKCNFYRVGFYTNVDSTKGPEGKVGLSVEMAFGAEYNYEDLDIDFIVDNVIEELQRWGWIDSVITVDPTYIRHAYTWLRDGNEPKKHIDWLNKHDIISIGRYGTWKFQGIVESIKDGLNVS